MSRIQRAILSVTDKTGLVEFARRLSALGVELVSTGGTAKLLRDSGITVKDISELTGFPEMLDGRVKTLHPKVHGGILHIRENAAHRAAVAEHGIEPIDMVVVNLYAFEKTASKPGVEFHEMIENIDIGGPSMVRSAAKNFQDVAIVTSPADYEAIAAEMQASGGKLSLKTKWGLAQKAFATTAAYDSAIASALEKIGAPEADGGKFSLDGGGGFPKTLRLSYRKAFDLRYGENPHQKAALYSDGSGVGVANGKQLQGKELSYNNIVDMQAAWDLAQEFTEPVCAIIKHTNPCGTAVAATLAEAYKRALECDPVSAFGGVIGVNRPVDADTATEMAKLFLEVIAAPAFDPAAREIFARKKNLRLVEVVAVRAEVGAEERLRRRAAAGQRRAPAQRRRSQGCQQASAQRAGDARSAVCVEGGQAREVERHSVRAQRPDHRRGRRTDEPRGFGAHWGHEVGAGDSRLGGGLGRVLPLPRRRGGDCQGRCDCHHPARRLG